MIKIILMAGPLACATLVSAWATDLTVVVDGVRDSSGYVAVGVFNSESSFPRAPQAFASFRVKVEQSSAGVTFRDLPPGRYAASAYHDENNNGKLDTDTVGFPTEGYGFSNGARGSLGPPEFTQAAFELRNEPKRVTVKVAY
jgi:uncharacterized protein (DUF2141 family)